MPKILITGCSSGFGLAIAQKFLNAGWDVVATMRTPQNNLLPSDGRLEILPLDVTSADSIAEAVEAAGTIDALVNNAASACSMCSKARICRRFANCSRQTSSAQWR